MAKTKTKTKKESLEEAVAEAIGAGREHHLPTVDFSDPNRPKTCLEVDFPILPINHVAAIEGNAGKPVYQMSKWWARRRSSVFRAMLIAGATQSPDDPADAAKIVWDAYYGNHQKNAGFRKLKVADIFMGGGTTVVEGARLGMQMYGNDLNPVAWFVVKNELAQVEPTEVKKLLDHIEAEVKPQIMPFYACDCPRGHKGTWKQKSTGKVMGSDFDPLALTQAQRSGYVYAGPEIIYTFWAKHGPCKATECNHRTPIMSSPVIAMKTLTVKAWMGRECTQCGEIFDVEQHEARMAPGVLFVVADDEEPYVVMDDNGRYACPHCGHKYHDEAAAVKGESSAIGKAKNKSVELTVLVHPDWLKGASGCSTNGAAYGGNVTDSADSTVEWNLTRASSLRLIEIRGQLPESIKCPDTGEIFYTDHRGGTVPRKSIFACKEETCGREQDVLTAINESGLSGAVAAYAVNGFCPECDASGFGGRFYAIPNVDAINAAFIEWDKASEFRHYVPTSSIPEGLETSVRTPLQKYHYHRWTDFYNPRQLLLHSQLLCAITQAPHEHHNQATKEFVLGAFQQYLRNQSMLSFWHLTKDHFAPALSKNNYQPKNTAVEVGVFAPVGYGPWSSTVKPLFESLDWKAHPWEIVPKALLPEELARGIGTAKSVKVYPGDPVIPGATLLCGTSTTLPAIEDRSCDLVITDPPFGDIMQYGELSSFFYPWLKKALSQSYPDLFVHDLPPTALEAVENLFRHGKEAAAFYNRLLTQCWSEANRILKPAGILAFTFHHDKDGPWISVLESLFNSGFYLEATFPIRSDETKGEGSDPGTFGAQKVEYDIIHVCRKRVDGPQEISWARLRRQIMQDVQQLREILEQHQTSGLQEADLQVIRRGKALEYYSKHYGKVYVEKGREFTVREALVGINQLLDDERDTNKESPPVNAEPFTRQFLRLFAGKSSLPRDQMQKYLRGTGVSPNEFESRGWCSETQKVFHVTSPLELAKEWKGVTRSGMSRDFDQAMFLIGACYETSGIRVQDTLDSPHFSPHPATGEIIDWLTRHGGSSEIKNAASLAKQLYGRWQAANKPKIEKQRSLFDLEEVGV